MRITDVKVTVWKWKDIPPTRYTLRVKSSGTKSVEMGLVRIITDEGIEGHAFLGNALATLGNDGRMVVDRFNLVPSQRVFRIAWGVHRLNPAHQISHQNEQRSMARP